MKSGIRHFVSGALLAATAVVGILFAAQAGSATIVGTKHDFTSQTWKTSDQVCIYCHAPHNTNTSAPLWNHTLSTATYTLYTSTTLNASGAAIGGVSKVCLSCHDGTVAVDSFGGATGGHLITGDANLSNDLTNDHPIGFTYDSTLATADGALISPASANAVVAGIPLFTAKLECASCHAVHDNTNAPFLRVSNAGSALCLKCHVK